MSEIPLVSCLCVTFKKLKYLKNSIHNFNAQTYPNRELVVVHQSHDVETKEYLTSLNDDRVRGCLVDSSIAYSLGELRNISLQHAQGEYFCQWDDDDWYHVDRITTQIDAIKCTRKPASVLINILIYNSITKDVFVSLPRPWENSIMGKKSLFGGIHFYPKLNRGEDSAFVKGLIKENLLAPALSTISYIYVYHGQNTSGRNHFQDIFDHSFPLPARLGLLVADIINGTYTFKEGSDLLSSDDFLKEINYFHWASVE